MHQTELKEISKFKRKNLNYWTITKNGQEAN